MLRKSAFIVAFLASAVFSIAQDSLRQDRRFLIRDEGKSQLGLVDLSAPGNNWVREIPKGRDIQLVGEGKVMIGTESGYAEYDIETGEKVLELSTYDGTISARRLKNGNTVLIGLNWQEREGIVLVEVDADGVQQNAINYPGYNYVRLLRETPEGNFLITSDSLVLEGDRQGSIIWKARTVGGRANPHAWQAQRRSDGSTVLAGGYTGNIEIYDEKGVRIQVIDGPEWVNPRFYAGMQILLNGNVVVTNWQGHGPEAGQRGVQLLEYAPDGALVWYWKQDPEVYSSLQGVIVLDNLDPQFLHVEGETGALVPVK